MSHLRIFLLRTNFQTLHLNSESLFSPNLVVLYSESLNMFFLFETYNFFYFKLILPSPQIFVTFISSFVLFKKIKVIKIKYSLSIYLIF
jgi:hypothetical protein